MGVAFGYLNQVQDDGVVQGGDYLSPPGRGSHVGVKVLCGRDSYKKTAHKKAQTMKVVWAFSQRE